ncbi:EF-Tu/IF-2/RF-3 family GTPase [Methanohalophilus sp.]|uniref:EF-Tu/IF-2/RF-3 family GTPase n=1 Tax=Methanohalophilus sp. TaxID=1966352 RepID=UPI00260830BB|nr:EF-Tu/IF-2/RF-3 family GTPase [Methanohalophilus sp.]MDK2892462.1 selenocysteine-specific elongation factor [Methanohalophilus sp.]
MTKVAIIGSEQSGRTSLATKLGKKGNVADITMYDFSKNDIVMTTIDANGYPKSLKSLITALNLSDIALLCIPPEGPDVATGECLVALELLQYKHGMIVLTKADTSYAYAQEELEKKIRKIISGTCMQNWEFINVSTQSFEGLDKLKERILEIDKKVSEENRKLDEKPVRVMVDQSFNVTGIGCVVLGVVTQGTLNAKDKLTAYPTAKPLEVRSIQMHDVDVKSASTGSRVGLALKGIQSKDIERGFVLSERENVAESFTLKSRISPYSAPLAVSNVLHLFVGLQSTPVRLEKIEIDGEAVDMVNPGDECVLYLRGSHEIAFSSPDRFILSNLDAKQRFVGYGFAETDD